MIFKLTVSGLLRRDRTSKKGEILSNALQIVFYCFTASLLEISQELSS